MEKIIVIGCPGSGKSTLAKALHTITGIPLYHLDRMYWNPDRTTVERPVFLERLAKALGESRWIIDGNFASTMAQRMAACDTVIFLDYPVEICLDGIRQRRGKPRSDIPWVEWSEDEEFTAFVKSFPTQGREEILKLLTRYPEKKQIVLKSRGEADAFLAALGEKRRCAWCNMKNPLYIDYHDNEWGRPGYDDRRLYEMLILESFQAGLSWECVLGKRENFRRAYDNFDIEKVCTYGEEKIASLLQDETIIRNKRKIQASIKNSVTFKEITKEYGSFYNYLTRFWSGNILRETGKTKNDLSDAISADLYRRGMRFVGSTIIYAYLQAIGIIDGHDETCFLHHQST